LIQGETGTGKELLARALHEQSPRADKPFVALNCAALPDNLLESELFGYKKGAFTGASRDKPGRFALASHGTLFLDEIGEIGPAVQVKLLRVLQEHVYEPLGAVRAEKTDARIVLATNRNLAELVQAGSFRQDLFYRINVIAMELPPLRERLEDLPLLIEHFLERCARLQDRAQLGIAPEALALLTAHSWPGNVRELENVIERACVLCGGPLIGLEHLPLELRAGAAGAAKGSAIASLKRLTERQYILSALERNGFNKAATARELGIHKTTLFRKLKILGLAGD
jgi:transcriptional regulator with PAS, ATPase and Fis domain